jgi:hypothetical protein
MVWPFFLISFHKCQLLRLDSILPMTFFAHRAT